MKWWEYQKLLDGGPFMTSADHRIVVQRESIPIVFVPGIMGSRLKRGANRVWDPNSTSFMLNTYLFATPSQRKALLDEQGLEVDIDTSSSFQGTVQSAAMKQECGGTLGMMGFGDLPPSMQQEIVQTADDRSKAAVAQGWGSVAWDFYGGILGFLAGQDWKDDKCDFGKCFVFPVYAVGYNWVQDNLKSGSYLASKFQPIIDKEKAKGLICEKIILVSHSMGGMVTRSAVTLNGGGGVVLGVIHGAQPVLGAPAAHRRIRAGFESSWSPLDMLGAKVLGSSSKAVMPVLANSVGGLELLPTTLYKANNGSATWLSQTKDGATIDSGPKGDPNPSIYENTSDFLRLIYHPEYLVPEDQTTDRAPTSTNSVLREAKANFIGKMETARSFHAQLQLQCHPVTYSSWVGDNGLNTLDTVEFKFRQKHVDFDPALYYNSGFAASPYGGPIVVDPNPEEGSGVDLWNNPANPSQDGYYEVQSASGKGDGTVPRSSGAGLSAQSKGIGEKLNTKVISSVEHSDFYNNGEVQKFTVNCIKELAKKQFKTRMGG
jgi:hypothetical protein